MWVNQRDRSDELKVRREMRPERGLWITRKVVRPRPVGRNGECNVCPVRVRGPRNWSAERIRIAI